MNLIKKNMVLVIVLCSTIVISLGLLYIVSRKYGVMKKSLAELQTLRDEINELNKKPIAPLQENIDRIHADYLFIRESSKDLQQVFGKPYHQALLAFATALEFDSVAAMKEKWLADYRRESARNVKAPQAFLKFLGEFDREKVDRAVAEFKRVADEHSVELLNESSLNDVIMEALGHPRKMSPEACKTYIKQMQTDLVQLLQPSEKERMQEGEHVVILGKDIEKFTFGDFDNRMPLRSDVSYIVKNWKMIEDLAYRLKKTQIANWNSITRGETLKGREEDVYLYLPYQIEIESSQASVQAFLNSLQDASLDQRIYIVRDIELSKSDDEVGELTSRIENATAAATTTRRPSVAGGFTEAETPMDNSEQVFGRPLIGRKQNVKAKISFDYVIFIGDEIKGE
jgi:hypothetical protein